MPQSRRRVVILDSPCTVWRYERRRELAMLARRTPAQKSRVLAFTFDDVPSALVENGQRIVLKPLGGMKS